MNNEKTKRIMEALAQVAEAVGNLRELLPAGSDLVDDVARDVTEVSDHILETAMLGEIGSPERTGDTVPASTKRKTGPKPVAAPAAKAKRTYTRKDKLGEPSIAPKPAPDAPPSVPADKPKARFGVQGVCVICGKTYLKRSPVQKTCSPECTAAKNRAYQKNKYAERADTVDASDRLARIKAADKRLDTID